MGVFSQWKITFGIILFYCCQIWMNCYLPTYLQKSLNICRELLFSLGNIPAELGAQVNDVNANERSTHRSRGITWDFMTTAN